MTLVEKIGIAMSQAEDELPDGYEIIVEIKRGKTAVVLLIPPVSDEEGGTFERDASRLNLAAKIRVATKKARLHAGDVSRV